ncbi:MAG TPA: trypsin-like peptidase domain-containing protein [Candidatus Saccharimonadales bacterium]|nr:trypsin-like peptidase domain-containing protein [Candidatus Saccharimonadales bacterium]
MAETEDKTAKNSQTTPTPATKPAAAASKTKAKPATTLADLQQSFRKVSPSNIKPEHVHRAKYLGVVLLLIACLSLGFLGGWLGSMHRSDDTSLTASRQKEVVSSESNLISSIAKSVSPSVVSINVTSQSQQSSSDFFDFFGSGQQSQPQQQESAGTGIILSSNGVIVTNRHVVPDGTSSVSVTLSDGTTFDNVQVIGRTKQTASLDVAFLKISDTKGKHLVPAALGDSSKMQVGDRVVAIGNALGQYQNTVTSGIISGYGRSVQASDGGSGSGENLEDLFQTDASINPGNSGGPLVNSDAQVIGINTAVASDAQGIGFAIPINDVKGLIDTVLSTGKFEQPYLGVRYLTLTDDYAKQLNLKTTTGAYVLPADKDNGQAGVVSGSPADKAGLQEGDVITEVNGTKIDQSHGLTSQLDQHQVGESVTLTIIRDGKQKTVHATLEPAPNN